MSGICISHPNAGRTWLQKILHSLDVDIEYSNMGTGIDKKEWGNVFENLPLEVPSGRSVVFLHRDPRDTLVSFFYNMTDRQTPKLSREQAAHLQSRGRMPANTMETFIRSKRFGLERLCLFNIWCLENLKQAHVLSYEQFIDDPSLHIVRLLNFLNYDRSGKDIGDAIFSATLSSMQNIDREEVLAAESAGRPAAGEQGDPNNHEVRAGGTGIWQEKMSAETAAFADEYLCQSRYFEKVQQYVPAG